MSKYSADDLHDLIGAASARLHRAGYDQGHLVPSDADLVETAELLDDAAKAARSLVTPKPKGKGSD